MRRWLTILAPAGALLALAALAVSRRDARAAITLVVTFAALCAVAAQRRWPGWARAVLCGLLVLALVPYALAIADAIEDNLDDVPEWDFTGFWLHARSAVAGLNFYDPRTLQQATAGMSLSGEVRTEIVDVPFWYPPPSMFLLLPLGWFASPSSALAFWYALQLAILAATALLCRRTFFPGGGAVELAASVLLVCLCHGTRLTFSYGQTNFIALAALLAFWRVRDTPAGGAWAAIAVCAKPLLAVLPLWMLLAGRFPALRGFALAVAALLLGALGVFGAETNLSYFAGDHLGAKPDWIYSQPTNQSLLGWVLRATGGACSGAQCVWNPWFVAGAAALGAASLALSWGVLRSRGADDEWPLALLVAWVLLVYPVSQLFYSVLLIPPLLLAWRERQRIAGGAPLVASVAAAAYVLCALANGRRTVYAFALVWLAAAAVCFALWRGGGWPLRAVSRRARANAG
jgi:hypothetical protein